jgi:hypothetical protein
MGARCPHRATAQPPLRILGNRLSGILDGDVPARWGHRASSGEGKYVGAGSSCVYQKRKYRWAIGSTFAGSQVRTRPSALTV